MGAQELAQRDFVWLVGSVCQINRIPFDPALLLQRFPAPHSERQLLEALQSLGFRTGEALLATATFPCIAFLRGEPARPALVLRSDGAKHLYFEAGSQAPRRCGAADDRFEPRALLLRHELAAKLEGDGAPAARGFGFAWFWSELLKHRAVWRDVLLASLF